MNYQQIEKILSEISEKYSNVKIISNGYTLTVKIDGIRGYCIRVIKKPTNDQIIVDLGGPVGMNIFTDNFMFATCITVRKPNSFAYEKYIVGCIKYLKFFRTKKELEQINAEFR